MKFLNLFIPKWLKALDRKLLLNHPQTWVTKIHLLFFFILLIDALLFGVTYVSYQLDFSDRYYSYYFVDFEPAFLIMLLPTVAVFIWWFVIQSWYNVDKNYGQLSISQDFTNFLLYWLIAILIASMAVVIPQAMYLKASSQLNESELRSDFEVVYRFESYFRDYDHDHKVLFENNKYIVYRSASIQWENLDEGEYYYYENEFPKQKEVLNEDDIVEELSDYSNIVNKYIRFNSSELSHLDPDWFIDDLRNSGFSHFDYHYEVENKIWDLYQLKSNKSRSFPFWSTEFLKILIAISGVFALLTWIFKNVHWKNFVAALVIQILIPVFIGIFAIFYHMLSIREDELTTFILILFFSCLSLIVALVPWQKKIHNSAGIISAITFQLWMPFLPFILFLLWADFNDHLYSHQRAWEILSFTYYIGIGLVLITLPLFKTYYSRMWALPKAK